MMQPSAYLAALAAQITASSVGLFGILDASPVAAGAGFITATALQVWVLIKLGPINVRLAVIEERLAHLEAPAVKTQRRRHDTPPIE